jgi:glycosyltransferase involved in cell wall biosynthesis
MKVIYYLPHPNFFSVDPFGRVTHAIGIINGLIENGVATTVISEEGIDNFRNEIDPAATIITLAKNSYLAHLRLLKNRQLFSGLDMLLYRKTVLGFVWVLMFRLLRINNKVSIISEVNGLFFDYQQRYVGSLFALVGEVIHKFFLRYDKKVYVVNEDLKEKLTRGLLGIKKEKLLVIHNGAPRERFLPFKSYDSTTLRLVFFGILMDYNELQLFIELFQERSYPNVSLEIVGDGPQREELERLSEGTANVTFHGRLTSLAFHQLLVSWKCHICGIVPMRMGNAKKSLSPIKAFDYMSFGLPILYSNLCLQDKLTDGVTGFEYQNGNSESVKNCIDNALQADKFISVHESVKKLYPEHTWLSRMNKLLKNV